MHYLVLTLCIIYFVESFAQEPQWRTLPAAPVEQDDRFEDGYFIDDSTGWIINLDGDVYKTMDAGTSWNLIYSRNQNEVAFRCVNFISKQKGFIGDISIESNADSSVLYRTTDGGFSWLPVQLPDPIPSGLCGLYSLDDQLIYGVGRYYGPPLFIKSEDGGISWQTFSLEPMAYGLVDVYFISSDTGFVAGSVNQSDLKGAIFKTVNGGVNWELVATTSLSGISCWKISFPSPSVGYVSFQGGGTDLLVLKTTDSGSSWTEINYSLPANFSTQGIGFVDNLTGWVGGFPFLDGTYKTSDGGFSWQSDDFGSNVNRFRFLNDTLGYAIGETIYKYSITPVSSVIIDNEFLIPAEFNLEQNYPNPFNPTTKIKYSIPSVGTQRAVSVQLKVYDVLGKEMVTLFNEDKPAGNYEVEFNASELPSGIYFYQFKTGSFVETRKMVLMK